MGPRIFVTSSLLVQGAARTLIQSKSDGQTVIEPLKSGTWGIKGTCRNNELIIAVDKPGNDPLTNQPWNTLSPGIDLFNGLGKFCSEYFLNSQCNASAYPLFLGFETNGPRCCRTATAIGLSSATATCASSEFAISGGHSCNTAQTGFVWPASTPSDVMGYVSVSRSVMGADGRSWTSDCRSNDSSIPINAKSVVYCCPL